MMNTKIVMYATVNVSYFVTKFLNLKILSNRYKHNFLAFFILYIISTLVILCRVSRISFSAKYHGHFHKVIHSFIHSRKTEKNDSNSLKETATNIVMASRF